MKVLRKGDTVYVPMTVKRCPVCGALLLNNAESSNYKMFYCFDCGSVYEVVGIGQADTELECKYAGEMEWMRK